MENHQPIWGEASLKPQELRIYRILFTVLEFRWNSWVKGLVLLNLQESRFLWTPNWLVRFLVDCPLNQFWELSVCRRNYIFGRATWYARKQILRGRKFWLCCFRWSAHIKFTLLDQWQRETAVFAFLLPHVQHPVATAMITWASFSHFFKASTPRRKLVNQHDFLAGPKTVVSIPHTWPIPIPQTFLVFFLGFQVGKSFVWGCPSRTESRTLGVLSLLGFQFDRLRQWAMENLQGRMGTAVLDVHFFPIASQKLTRSNWVNWVGCKAI